MSHLQESQLYKALDEFVIEIPSWGFADTGTRFGKFFQDAAASTIEEKLHDSGLVHKLTGICPTVAMHVLWDFPEGKTPQTIVKLAEKNGVKIGSINPNIFQDPQYKLGSLCSPDPAARQQALKHCQKSIEIGKATGSSALSMWMADGTNYPGQDSILRRKHNLEDAFKNLSQQMESDWPGSTLLVEYKPFEPAFYHTDIADWGMAYVFAKKAGKNAKVLVDTGHHLPGANIEHLVAFLLDENMLGGFHFNDRKYADDDLTLGSIDPYAMFRIFDQIAQYEFDCGQKADISYMVDQSHNLKPKLEAMVQTVTEAQKLFLKAQLVDRKKLATAQLAGDIVAAEIELKKAYETDVSKLIRNWRISKNLPENPLKHLRTSGIISKLGEQRAQGRAARGELRQSSYA